jgi:hypothetical protein
MSSWLFVRPLVSTAVSVGNAVGNSNLKLGGDRTQALNDIKSILPPEAQNLVYYDKNGYVHFDKTKVRRELQDDIGVEYLYKMITAEESYVYSRSDYSGYRLQKVDGESGQLIGRPYIGKSNESLLPPNENYITNYSIEPSGMKKRNGSYETADFLPLDSRNHAELTISGRGKWAEPAKLGFTEADVSPTIKLNKVNRAAVVLHEFIESYLRTTDHFRLKNAHDMAAAAAKAKITDTTDVRYARNPGWATYQ